MRFQKEIKFLRRKIDKITEKIIKLVAERERIVLEIGRVKKERGMPILDSEREKGLRKNSKKLIKKFKASPSCN